MAGKAKFDQEAAFKSELIADYVAANAGKLKEYDKIKTE